MIRLNGACLDDEEGQSRWEYTHGGRGEKREDISAKESKGNVLQQRLVQVSNGNTNKIPTLLSVVFCRSVALSLQESPISSFIVPEKMPCSPVCFFTQSTAFFTRQWESGERGLPQLYHTLIKINTRFLRITNAAHG